MNKRKLSVALLGAMLACGVAVAQTPQEAVAEYAKAAELYNAKKYDEAIPALESAVKIGLDAGEEAQETVKNAQNLLPTAYFQSGLAAAQAQNFDKAAEALGKADELAELYGNATVRNNVGTMLTRVYMANGGKAFNSKDYAKAIEVFSQGFGKYPTNTEIGLLLASSYAESGDLAKAFETYKNIIALESTHSKYVEPAKKAKDQMATYMLLKASEAAQANNLPEVIAITDQVLEIDPTNAATHLMRLQSAMTAKNYDAIIGFGEGAATAQVSDEEKSEAYFLIGAAYQNKENAAKAIEMYRKVTAGERVNEAKAQISALSK